MNEGGYLKTKAGNPDIKYPPNTGQAIPYSRPNVGYNGSPLIDSWVVAPTSGTFVLACIDGEIRWLTTEECPS